MNATGAGTGAAHAARGPRMECRICWHVYDPLEGDVVWQVPPDTPFAALPAHWSCPNCSATKDQFLVVEADAAADDDAR